MPAVRCDEAAAAAAAATDCALSSCIEGGMCVGELLPLAVGVLNLRDIDRPMVDVMVLAGGAEVMPLRAVAWSWSYEP